MSVLSDKKMRVIKANLNWNDLYEELPIKKKEKKISFVESQMKVNIQTQCTCNLENFFNCELHDGSDPRNKKFHKLIENYFAHMRFFNESTLIKYLDENIELVVFCIKQIKNVMERLEIRKKEIFESELYECYVKKFISRVFVIDDFDPKWDNIKLDLEAAKKQMKNTKVSVIKNGSRGLNASLEYNHIPYIKRLHNLLENVHESMFLEFIL